jgi:hypothetical protein
LQPVIAGQREGLWTPDCQTVQVMEGNSSGVRIAPKVLLPRKAYASS